MQSTEQTESIRTLTYTFVVPHICEQPQKGES